MPLKFNPYLGEWIVLPEGASITNEELQRAAASRQSIIEQRRTEERNSRKLETWPPNATITIAGYVFPVVYDVTMPKDRIKLVDTAAPASAPPDATIVFGPPYIETMGNPWPAEQREDIAASQAIWSGA